MENKGRKRYGDGGREKRSKKRSQRRRKVAGEADR